MDFIFEKVLELKRQQLRPEVPLPALRFSSTTTLEEFQLSMLEQWGMRVDHITNAYSLKYHKIFLMDDSTYYQRTGRCMDDSLAHELTHFVQAKYQGFDLNDESLEWDAIDVQTAFREAWCK